MSELRERLRYMSKGSWYSSIMNRCFIEEIMRKIDVSYSPQWEEVLEETGGDASE